EPLEVFVGPPIWANKQWVGKIYPHDAKDADFLFHYAQQFNTIELNVTHYQIPNDNTINRWKSQVGKDFKFCPKFPQSISHERQLVGAADSTNQFVEQILKLEANLGITFLQLPPYFGFNRLAVLEDFLKTLPKELELAVEFRHESWFENEKNWERTVLALADLGVGTVITDVSGRRDVVHMSLSTDTLTLRFIANNLHETDFVRTDEWVSRIQKWYDAGLRKAYLFMHTEENTLAPEMSNYWVGQLNAMLNLKLKPAIIQAEVVQAKLF
ncbi:MAG: DUF72 domain-containing protein, partial [Spirosomaceae bacterium]|nr:DUF72 domain-containing protein [Spirosomataceae bacterium]